MKNFDDFLKTVDMNKLVSPTVDVIENSDNPISAISALSTSITINLLGCLCICCSEQMLVPLFVYSSTHTGELMM